MYFGKICAASRNDAPLGEDDIFSVECRRDGALPLDHCDAVFVGGDGFDKAAALDALRQARKTSA